MMPRNAKGRAIRIAVLLICILLSACSSGPERAYDSRSASSICLPCFPDRDGWYGGDGAYSIRLDDRRVLWLFGDSFVSEEEDRKNRVGMEVILGTTLATSTCTPDGVFHIRYWLKKRDGQFVSSFGEDEWLWPQDPFMADGTLYVPLVSVRANPEMAGPFKFEILGHKIARIGHFEGEDPNRWPVDYADLTPGILDGVQAFATTSVVYGEHVYFYPLYSGAKDGRAVLGNILARIPIRRLDDPARAVEYLTTEGRWEKGPDHARVKVVLEAAVSEMSVRYHPDEGKWVAVYLSVRNNGDQMLCRKADRLEGPWSEPEVLIGSIPEVDPNSPRYDRNTFCYAGKEHREFARGRNPVVTYVCNSHDDFEKDSSFIRRNLFLYRPVVRHLNP